MKRLAIWIAVVISAGPLAFSASARGASSSLAENVGRAGLPTMSQGGSLEAGTLVFEGQEEPYLVYVPAGNVLSVPAPVVVVLPGSDAAGEAMLRVGFNDQADRAGFIVVYPNYRIGLVWIDFVSQLLDFVQSSFNVDPDRVFLTGFSGGAAAVHLVACALSDRLTAVAAVDGAYALLDPGVLNVQGSAYHCRPTRPISVLHFHGSAREPGYTNAVALIRLWRELNACGEEPRAAFYETAGDRAMRESYLCQGGTEVALFSIETNIHGWPGAPRQEGDLPIASGEQVPASMAVDATAAIAEFFMAARAPTRAAPPEILQAGVLRVGVLPRSPFHSGRDPVTGELRGVPADLARELVRRIGVALEFVEYDDPGQVVEMTRASLWDVVLGDDDPGRREVLDFAVFIENDQTYLVPAESQIQTVADADRPGVRIAVDGGAAADRTLSRILEHATLVRYEPPDSRIEVLRSARADAAAAGRGTLLRDAPQLPGSRVLDDAYAVTRFALGVDLNRPELFAYVREFVEDTLASGFVRESVERWGLVGYRVPQVP